MISKDAHNKSTHTCAQQGGSCQANTQRLLVRQKLCFLRNTVVTLGAGPEVLRTAGAFHGIYEKINRPEIIYMLILYLKTTVFKVKTNQCHY